MTFRLLPILNFYPNLSVMVMQSTVDSRKPLLTGISIQTKKEKLTREIQHLAYFVKEKKEDFNECLPSNFRLKLQFE